MKTQVHAMPVLKAFIKNIDMIREFITKGGNDDRAAILRALEEVNDEYVTLYHCEKQTKAKMISYWQQLREKTKGDKNDAIHSDAR